MSTKLICVGLNHLRTPIEIRERVVFAKEQLPQALNLLKSCSQVNEAAIINTCNRVEIYADVESSNAQNSVEDFLHRFHNLPQQYLQPHLYSFWDRSALHQLLRVTASLDSQIIGEPQILGQVKDAYKHANDAGTVGPKLKQIFSKAFNTAKKIRTQTKIGQNAVSINYAITQLCKKVFGRDQQLNCLLIGVGDMASLSAHHFHSRQCTITILNRTLSKCEVLAKSLNAQAASLDKLEELLPTADLVICSTASPTYLLQLPQIEHALKQRRYRPMLLIDLSVPRNIDPKVQNIDQIYAYDLDDLAKIIAQNMQARADETLVAESIINEELDSFIARRHEQLINPYIEEIFTQTQIIASEELERLFTSCGPLLDDGTREKIALMTHRLSRKILHRPLIELKKIPHYAKAPPQ